MKKQTIISMLMSIFAILTIVFALLAIWIDSSLYDKLFKTFLIFSCVTLFFIGADCENDEEPNTLNHE